MKRFIFTLIIMFIFGCNQSNIDTPDEPKKKPNTNTIAEIVAKPQITEQVKKLANDNNVFALKLYQSLKNSGKNIFFSPYSISNALAMTYVGAKNNTAREIKEVLNFQLDDEELHQAYKNLILLANIANSNYELNVANSLWLQKKYNFLQKFTDVNQNQYLSKLETVDFSTVEETRGKINKWVEQKTKEKIQNLIPENGIDSSTKLVLVNAIHFKGDWDVQFKEEYTSEDDFTLTDGTIIQTTMMRQRDSFKYMENSSLQILEIPYKGEELAMLVVLPKGNLQNLEPNVNIQNLGEWCTELSEQKVDIQFPKFKMTSSFELKNALSSMGMPEAFSMQADLSGMTGNKELYISKVLHKAFVEINEKGTEAAAATAVVANRKSVERVARFHANRPFIFMIRDLRTNSILFLGKLIDPRD